MLCTFYRVLQVIQCLFTRDIHRLPLMRAIPLYLQVLTLTVAMPHSPATLLGYPPPTLPGYPSPQGVPPPTIYSQDSGYPPTKPPVQVPSPMPTGSVGSSGMPIGFGVMVSY